MTTTRQDTPTTKAPHFATLLVMTFDAKEIGERIAARREELGWTHQRVADEMNVRLRTAQRWQEGVDAKGNSLLPRVGRLMELAEKMGVEPSYFVDAPAPGAQEEIQAALLRDVADGISELERSSEHVLEQLDEALARLAAIEAAVLPPGDARHTRS